MYAFKYPEKTNRDTDEPWSIRQTALYHQIQYDDQKSTFFAISPYKNTKGEQRLIRWLQQAAPTENATQDIIRVHSVLFDTYIDGWREYMTHYESELEELVRESNRALCSANFVTDITLAQHWTEGR